jgi:UDP-glucuronate 4-epimerase
MIIRKQHPIMATTLITGGAGFIGSHLAARLIQLQQSVVILDNFDSYYDPAVKRANIAALGGGAAVITGDIRDEALLRTIFEQHRIERVAHLAALSGVRYSIERARLYAEVNTLGSVALMDMARKHSVSVFVQASTSNVYGQTARVPFVEDDAADRPLSPYPASKRAAEIFAHSFHQMFGLNVTVLRFFNVYGPRGRPDMMPLRTIEALLKGTPLDLYDGGALERDWTFIDDTVDGILAALERPQGFAILNLGCGAPIRLTEFIRIYEELIGKRAVTRSVPAPASEPRITYCDNTRARQQLGFSPKVSIAEGLARTWAWYRAQHGL